MRAPIQSRIWMSALSAIPAALILLLLTMTVVNAGPTTPGSRNLRPANLAPPFDGQVKLTNRIDGVVTNISTNIIVITNLPVSDVIGFGPLSSVTMAEGAAEFLLSIVREGPATNAASVRLSTLPGSALPIEDYSPLDFVVQFPPGVTAVSFMLSAAADERTEGLEFFNLQLDQPIAAVLGNSSLPVGILDISVDPVKILDRFSLVGPDPLVLQEGASPSLIEVVREGPATNHASVEVVTLGGTALPAVDFSGVNQVLSFPIGVRSQLVPLSAWADLLTEGDEFATLMLQNPVGATVLGGMRSVRIEDLSLDPTNRMADLELAASVTPATPVEADELVALTVTVSNRGPDPAQGVAVSVPVPAGWVMAALPPLPGQETYDPLAGRWSVGSLAAGGSRTMTLGIRAVTPGESSTAVEIVGSSLPDPDSVPGNGIPGEDDLQFVFLKIQVPAMADLALTKTATPDVAEITQKSVFEITVENLGPNDAKNITITDTLPAGLDIDKVEEPFGTTFVKNTGVWTVPALANGGKRTLKLTVKTATGGGTYTNRVAITAAAPADPVAANNLAEAVLRLVGYTACGVATVCNDGPSLPNANALVTLEKGVLKRTVRTDALGGFCFSNLLAGEYDLTIDPADPKSGIIQVKQKLTVSDTPGVNNYTADRRLIVGSVLFGTNGLPRVGVTVEAVGGGKTLKTKTDANGQFRFEGLEAVEYTVTPEKPDSGTYKPAEFKVDYTRALVPCPARVDFILDGAFTISGLIKACNARGVPLSYMLVSLSLDGGPVIRTTRTGMDGRYSFTRLPPGKYVVTPSSPPYTFTARSEKVTIVKENHVANFFANPGNLISGRVMGANKEGLSGIQVELFALNGNAPVAVTTSGPDGEFNFPAQANGNWVVIPKPPEAGFTFNPARFVITLGGNNPTCVVYPFFFGNRNAAELVALEVNQVIQDWQNSVPLVAGKAAVVRAHVKPAGTNTTPVSISGAKLKVERDGKVVLRIDPNKSPVLARRDYDADPIRSEWTHSLNFSLPAEQAKGDLTLTLEWPGGVLTTFLDPAGKQTAVRNNSTTVKFTLAGKDHTPTAGQLANQAARLRAGLPSPTIPDPTGGNLTTMTWTIPKGMDPSDLANSADDIEKLRASLQRALQRKRNDDVIIEGNRTLYYGVLVDTVIGGQAGAIGSTTAFGDVTHRSEPERNLPTHEVGHALGLHHDVHTAFGIKFNQGKPLKQGFCNEIAQLLAPDYPMDVSRHGTLTPTLGPMREGPFKLAYGWERSLLKVVSPFKTADIMSYCQWDTDWVWPGIPSYKGMFDAMKGRFGPRRLAFRLADGDGLPVVRLSGLLAPDGSLVELDPVQSLALPEPPPLPEPGELSVRFVDGVGMTLSETPFEAEELVSESAEGNPAGFAMFDVLVPLPETFTAVEIWREGVRLERIEASAHAPSLTVEAPSAPVELAETPVEVRWTAADADGDPLRFSIEVSADAGMTWQQVVAGLTESRFSLLPNQLPPGLEFSLRVRASDGFRTTTTPATGVLRRGSSAPFVEVVHPLVNQVFAHGEILRLEALATDREDGELTPESIEWSSDRGGVLGVGPALEVAATQLEPGLHRLKVRATDRGGLTSEATVTIDIVERRRLPLRIVPLLGEVEIWWPADSPGVRLEASEDPDTEGWYPVESEPELDGEWFHLRVPVGDEPIFFRLAEPSEG
jgi:uncharacterized repeat protein (TIGR01451 family)